MAIPSDQLKNEMMSWLNCRPKDYSEMKFKEIFELVNRRNHTHKYTAGCFCETFCKPITDILDEVN